MLDKDARGRALTEWGFDCVAANYRNPVWSKPCSEDSGTPSVQWAHVVRRGRGLTRRENGNARPLCAVHHAYFTNAPEAWVLFVDALMGVDEHRDLMRRSLADGQLDLETEWDQMKAREAK